MRFTVHPVASSDTPLGFGTAPKQSPGVVSSPNGVQLCDASARHDTCGFRVKSSVDDCISLLCLFGEGTCVLVILIQQDTNGTVLLGTAPELP